MTAAATVGPVDLGTDLLQADVGDQFTEPFVVVGKDLAETRNGDPMLRLRFANFRGQKIGATAFKETVERWTSIRLGDPVQLTARVGDYKGTKQLDILGVTPLEQPHPVCAAMNEVCPPDRYQAALDGLRAHLAAITHPGYRLFLQRFFEGACPEEDFLTCPAAKGNHHAYVGGLVEHSIEVTDFGVLGALQPGARRLADLNLLRTSCIIHDAGKLWEYTWKNMPIGMAPLERLYNHLVTGPIMTWLTFQAFREELEALGFTERHALHVMHIQTSHHGKLAWGSPIVPKTMEAMLAHAADQQSAQMRKMAEAIATHDAADTGLITGTASFRFGLMAEPSGSRAVDPAWTSIDDVRRATNNAPDFAAMPVVTALPGHATPITGAPPTCPPDLHARAVADFRAHCAAVQHPGYRRFLDLLFTETCPEERFLECPIGIDGPEAYLGGLVERTAEIANLAVMSASAPGARGVAHLDLVRVGALVHALGKVRSYTWGPDGLAFTDAGQLLPPTVLGPLMLHECFHGHRAELEAMGFTLDDLHHLVHVQASYHGTLEAGSPSAPTTFSAQVVHTSFTMSRQTRDMAVERLALYGQSLTLAPLTDVPSAAVPRARRAPTKAAKPRTKRPKSGTAEADGVAAPEGVPTGAAASLSAERLLNAVIPAVSHDAVSTPGGPLAAGLLTTGADRSPRRPQPS